MTSYSWRRAVKDNRIAGTAVYYAKHGFLPGVRVSLRMAKIERLRRAGSYDAEGISAFRKVHDGECCFVVGNGPSVTCGDLDAINDAGLCSFGANRISDLFSSTRWRPAYMCAMEHGFLLKAGGEEAIDAYIANLRQCGVEHAFVNEEFRNQVSSRDARSTAVFVRCPLAPTYTTDIMPFSEDASLYVSDLGSVTHFAIQLACYMGFKRIYLYGVDNAYSKYLGIDGAFHIVGQAASHAAGIAAVRDDDGISRVPTSKADAYCAGGFADMRKSELGYRCCADYANKHGIEILNATNGGKLETFKRISLSDALRREAACE